VLVQPNQRPEQIEKEEQMSVNSHQVLPQVKESLLRFISSIGASLPRNGTDIESLVIKDDKVFIRYKVGSAAPEGVLDAGQSVTASALKVLNLGDGKIMEQLNAVYQVKTY
jgi:hypothetical protein